MKEETKKQLQKFCEGRDSDGVLKDCLGFLVEIEEVRFMGGLPYWESCGETLGNLPELSDEE